MLRWIKEVYDRGGINTVSWHVDNPVTGGAAWDTVRTVALILPGGKDHANFVKKLDRVAAFLASCKSGDTSIPIIFRPLHEHNGSWFWWGKNHCTEQEFIQLWRFTVDYLKNKKNLHHILYAISPDRSRLDMKNLRKSYLYGYPGDDYVDIVGFDNYMDAGIKWNKKTKEEQINDLVKGLKTISGIAREKNKVAALTETGLEGITDTKWFTEVVLNPIKANKEIQLAYFMVWRNANEKHYYAPYPGHPSVEDFIGFYNDPYTIFEADLQNMYKTSEPLLRR
jgi:mannan endo-1,4-beta-mannosidase